MYAKVGILIFLLGSLLTGLECCVTYDVRPNWSLDITSSAAKRVARDVSIQDRSVCGPQAVSPPANRVDTSRRVQELVELMKEYKIDAYIVPTADEHQSEYVSDYDERRGFITGFSGSAGTAVILGTGDRALWTDGRYFLQADQQLDCNWLLMKERMDGVPTILEWLKKLPIGSIVGADPRLISAQEWLEYEKSLRESHIKMEPVQTNLVDIIWPGSNRTPRSQTPIEILGLQFAGKRWEDKVLDLREEMRKQEADMMVITAMDENAWLFNLRGGDVPHNPVFRSYSIIDSERVRLFLDKKISAEMDLHLNVNQCDKECVEIHDYKSVLQTLQGLASRPTVKKVLLPAKHSYSGGASYAVLMAVPESKRMMTVSPALLMKARKNEVEIQGMKNSHIRDAVALIDFLSLMEEEITAGKEWNEISAATRLEEFRAEQKNYHSLSFDTISAFDSNGAVIHYRPTNDTNRPITNKSLYLLDSGAQYKDGTTDVTRTLHYGTPTEIQIEAYTRVLKGALDVATLIFPKGTKDTRVDVLARRPLYEVGWNYNHGTGHGIGMFLNIHEAPIQMRIYGEEEHEFEVGHFFSDEPGFYIEGDFGIRLETILTVVQAETKYPSEVPMLGFEPVTLVPFEPKLIDVSLLDKRQCKYLNAYHDTVRKIVGPELQNQGRNRANAYMMERTEPLDCAAAGSEETPAVFQRQQIKKNVIGAQASAISSSSQTLATLGSIFLSVVPFLIVKILQR